MTDHAPSPFPAPGSGQDLEQGLVLSPRFDRDGLIAAVVSDVVTGEILMLAWMNAEALRLSIETGFGHFWSRSRARIWKKGEDSGNLLEITEMRVDCDQDAIWMKVRVHGPAVACHTGARSCFYRVVPLKVEQPGKLVRG